MKPMSDSKDQDVAAGALYWIAGGLTLAAIPHLDHLPLGVPILFVLLTIWRLGGALRGWPLPVPGKTLLVAVKYALAISTFLGIAAIYGNRIGRDAGVALLVALLGLKLLELIKERDAYVAIFLGYFLEITGFFYAQTIPVALHLLAVTGILTAGLVRLNDPRGVLSSPAYVRRATGLLVQSVPLMLAAFVLFPRIDGPLWGLPSDAHAGMTGLSDKMRLGEIQRLVMSDEVAFRVKFDGSVPKASQLYWRGPVLWHTDGRNWIPGPSVAAPAPRLDQLGSPVRYTVTVEPHNKRWLFLLDVPASLPPEGELQGDLQVLAREPVNKRLRYEAESSLAYRIASATPAELKRALQLPAGLHPKALALARSWKDSGANPEQLVNQGLLMFRQQHFYYTLTPDETESGDVIDHFLFISKHGFCEHYAAAFTVLMRAVGVPTRIVTGYQGGELNDLGGYVVIYQSDAHAWTEVWLGEDRGWVRMDPTAAVAPSRVDRGMDIALPRPMAVFPRALIDNTALQSLVRNLRHGWDALNNGWNQWVLNYGSKRQLELLNKLGMAAADWGDMVLALVVVTTVVLLAVSAWLFLRAPKPGDAIAAAYVRFCTRLSRLGYTRGGAEGPLAFAQRAAVGRPDLAADIAQVTRLYVDLRYGLALHHVKELAEAVRQFRPGRRRS